MREKQSDADASTVQTAGAALLAPAIAAEVHTDSHLLEAQFDAALWFSQADDEEIIELHAIEWRGDYASDEVAKFFESRNTEIAALLSYCRSTHDTRLAEGFECAVNADQAMIWLKQHRRGLWARLLCKDNNVQLVQAEEEQIRGMWDWLDDHNNACDHSFPTIEEAALNAVESLDQNAISSR